MLCVTREEVLNYLQARNLKWRTDHTNADCTYRRNFIRHRLLPVLQQECKDSVVETLSMLAQSARRFYRQVCEQVDEVWAGLVECKPERTTLDLKRFQSQSRPVKIELIRRCLNHLGCGQRDLTQQHYERIVQLAGRDVTGKEIQLPGGFIVRRDYGDVIFSRKKVLRFEVGISSPVKLKIPGQTRFGKYLIEAIICAVEQDALESSVECFDLERIKLPLSIRSRRVGDRFVPLGMSGEKKISKFLMAQRVPYNVRRQIVLVEDGEKIIWVWPIRISERAKVTAGTRQILQLQITESGNK
jgi:tRNA(Ile)-lysidine synthase